MLFCFIAAFVAVFFTKSFLLIRVAGEEDPAKTEIVLFVL